MQAIAAAQDLRRNDADMARSSDVLDEWRREVSLWRRPFYWFRHRRNIRKVVSESPYERDALKGYERRLLSWSLLTCATFFTLLGTVGLPL